MNWVVLGPKVMLDWIAIGHGFWETRYCIAMIEVMHPMQLGIFPQYLYVYRHLSAASMHHGDSPTHSEMFERIRTQGGNCIPDCDLRVDNWIHPFSCPWTRGSHSLGGTGGGEGLRVAEAEAEAVATSPGVPIPGTSLG
mmetsp:Transcript_572/g.1177  ORF Transcript_572/g.1177 Transcript_572/m.1177 type:complete len:139 (-) Transcript_572:1744-2160(-)